jgi:hypothetical protein
MEKEKVNADFIIMTFMETFWKIEKHLKMYDKRNIDEIDLVTMLTRCFKFGLRRLLEERDPNFPIIHDNNLKYVRRRGRIY